MDLSVRLERSRRAQPSPLQYARAPTPRPARTSRPLGARARDHGVVSVTGGADAARTAMATACHPLYARLARRVPRGDGP